MKKLFFEKTENEFLRIFRAIFVGGISTAVDFAVFFSLLKNPFFAREAVLFLSIKFWMIAQFFGFFSGAAVNYFLTHFFVFPREKIPTKKHFFDFFLFGIIGGIGFFLTLFLIFLFHEKFGFSLFWAKILSLIVFFWNYYARKVLIFDRKKNPNRRHFKSHAGFFFRRR